ncbi:unnamed protein product [Ixodes persulcatus]
MSPKADMPLVLRGFSNSRLKALIYHMRNKPKRPLATIICRLASQLQSAKTPYDKSFGLCSAKMPQCEKMTYPYAANKSLPCR